MYGCSVWSILRVLCTVERAAKTKNAFCINVLDDLRHNLAKVEVASSSLVSRSKTSVLWSMTCSCFGVSELGDPANRELFPIFSYHLSPPSIAPDGGGVLLLKFAFLDVTSGLGTS
jgi:hypothetical protein